MKIDFFISPAYRVPPISTSFLPKLITMNVPLRVPCRAGIRLEVGRVEHREPGTEVRQLAPAAARMNMLRTNSACQAFGVMNRTGTRIRGVGAAEEVLHVQLARVEVAADVLVQPVERLGLEPGILLPPDPVGGAGLLDDELVLGRPAGVGRGDGGEGAVIGELSFAAAERVFDERGRRQVGVNADREEAMLDEGEALSRNCARLGTHTLLGAWRAAKDSGRREAPAASGRNYRQVEAPETTGSGNRIGGKLS